MEPRTDRKRLFFILNLRRSVTGNPCAGLNILLFNELYLGAAFTSGTAAGKSYLTLTFTLHFLDLILGHKAD